VKEDIEIDKEDPMNLFDKNKETEQEEIELL
jgi:hypothetical protein